MEFSPQVLSHGMDTLISNAIPIATKIIGAVVLWVVAGFVIGIIRRSVTRMMTNRKVDKTLVQYADVALAVFLKILLIIAVLGVFGIETTSFAAILAAGGLAIGAAWSGLLSNFAAGVFLVILRPFKIGDFVTVGGITGDVREIGLFGTSLDTPDNVRTTVGNAKVLGETVHNFTTNPHRRVDLKAQIAHGVDPADAIKRLQAHLASLPNVLRTPAPVVELLEFNELGPLLAVRPYTHNDNYWNVYFATNKMISEVLADAGYPVPERHYAMRSAMAGQPGSSVRPMTN